MYQLMMCHGFWILQAPRYTLQKIINIEDQKTEIILRHESVHFAFKILHISTGPSFTDFLSNSTICRDQGTGFILLRKRRVELCYNDTDCGRFYLQIQAPGWEE